MFLVQPLEETIMTDTNETETANVPATGSISQRAMKTIEHSGDILSMIGAKIVKQVTRTVLQQQEGVPFAVEFESVAKDSEVQQPARGGAAKMGTARTCDVINLVSGAKQVLIMNTVLEGELNRNYPDGSYVGKQFAIRSHFPNDGENADGTPKKRRYKVYEIVEIEIQRHADTKDEVLIGDKVADGSDPVIRKGTKPKG